VSESVKEVQTARSGAPAGRSLFDTGRQRAQKWILDERDDVQLRKARSFCTRLLESYWEQIQREPSFAPPPLVENYETTRLTTPATKLARRLGKTASHLGPIEAGFEIGRTYTATLPTSYRTQHGIYYTPPVLTERLLSLATRAGIDWSTDTVLDPACGGGAFLAPAALRMVKARAEDEPSAVLDHIAHHLRGYELDPFGAWSSRVVLEAALLDQFRDAGRRLGNVIQVTDSLEHRTDDPTFDAVIGNPPYGRVTLASERREQYERSLYGHANIYGLFTDLALHLTAENGRIAFVTPTGFLAGQYFKALRRLLGREAPPVLIDFLSAREGVFADVLQETLLAVYNKARSSAETGTADVSVVTPTDSDTLQIEKAGTFKRPDDPTRPWIIPRRTEQGPLVEGMHEMPHRLHDYGYEVSTGPLVWNRYKEQLRSTPGDDTYPLIWAEAVTADGHFRFRSEKPNHEPYFTLGDDQDRFLIQQPCVLVQRTTAKEQHRRLIAAELPRSFIEEHNGVVIENHLNMVYTTEEDPAVSVAALTALLNSAIVDQAFRCISGSVAVSAYEMEALPLPSLDTMREVETLLRAESSADEIEHRFRTAYLP